MLFLTKVPGFQDTGARVSPCPEVLPQKLLYFPVGKVRVLFPEAFDL
jgi:hypothetical protein